MSRPATFLWISQAPRRVAMRDGKLAGVQAVPADPFAYSGSMRARVWLPVVALFGASVWCVVLVGRRHAYGPGGFRYLVWNLGLAWLPLVFALLLYVAFRRRHTIAELVALGAAWLVFLPNAPYMLTDFVHLGDRHRLVDSLILASFAFTALALGFASLLLVQIVVTRKAGAMVGWLVALGALFLPASACTSAASTASTAGTSSAARSSHGRCGRASDDPLGTATSSLRRARGGPNARVRRPLRRRRPRRGARPGGSAAGATVESTVAKPVEQLESVVIRFAGDSGDGMQLTGGRFTSETALVGQRPRDFPDFPAEIRAPAGSLPGVSGFQLHFADHDILTPGDRPDVLVAMNPAALKTNLGDLPKGATLIVDTDAFTERNLKKAGYATNPLEDGTLEDYQLHAVPLTSLTVGALKEIEGVTAREAERAKNMFALGLMSWLYGRATESTTTSSDEVREAAGDRGGEHEGVQRPATHFGETSEAFAVQYEVKPAKLPPAAIARSPATPRCRRG